MAKKNSLGRGLGALIENESQSSSKENKTDKKTNDTGVAEIDIQNIEANPYQPRTIFDNEALEELTSSIKEIGIIQPLTVRKIADNKYQLISGERRLRASKMAGVEKIPAYVRTANDQNLMEMALIENIQREDLDAIEISISYQRLIDECKLTQENLSKRVGKKRATISNYLRLLKLPAEIQLGIKENKISMGHARTLVNIEEPKTQLKIYSDIIAKELSVRKVEELVKSLKEKKEEASPSKGQPVKEQDLPESYKKLKNKLTDFFDSPIGFKRTPKGQGQIVIPFKSDDELERIIAIFDKLNS